MSDPSRYTFTRLTPSGAATGGAITLYQITARHDRGDCALDALFRALRLRPVRTGAAALRSIPDIDDALITRPRPEVVHIGLHAGRAVERLFESALSEAGVAHAAPGDLDPRTLYPEAGSLVEACVLDALARADSPACVDALLAQPALWADPGAREAAPGEAAQLERLLVAPVVAAVGHANVGKSTLLNALARRDAAIVADVPGTTLDHLGVTLTLDGVCVHWLDTPGWREGVKPASAEAAARRLAAQAVAHADLVLVCGDSGSGFLHAGLMGAPPGAPVLRVATRARLLPDTPPPEGADLVTDAHTGLGLEALAVSVADRLVPRELRERPPRWAFHPALKGDGLSFPPR